MSDSAVSFESVLLEQTLRGERLRLAVVAVFSLFAFIFFMVLYLFSPTTLEFLFHDKFSPKWAALIAGSVIVGELVVRQVVGHFQQLGRLPFRTVPYLSAFVEITIPTAVLYALSSIFGPVYVLVTPPVLLYGVFIVLSALRLSYRICFFSGFLAGAEYFLLSAYLLHSYHGPALDPVLTSLGSHLGKGMIFVGMGVISGVLTIQIRRGIARSYESMVERNRIVGVFGRHVSPAVVETLLTTDAQLGGKIHPVCLMFLDIRNFTAHSEKSNPIEVVEFLNSLFDFMVESINRHGGIINKFLGDGFMAVFGAPLLDEDKCAHAVAASLEILDRLEDFNASRGDDQVRIGIGLHAGQAVTGNVGALSRREYTIIGDVVNVASRIEQLNKTYDSALLLSDAVVHEIGERGFGVVDEGRMANKWSEALEQIGPASVKGHEAPIVIYRLA
ncbi:MAG TPA: adenylate/guanylate cyclase domain-containing protein [Spirochaetia bacterium]|nr:adenylate/guanylate cyclase domain-containing protein [Spirochaetia bacterium]